jgi:hypothetical protein
VLSVTFLTDIAEPSWTWALVTAWILFTASLLAIFGSFLASMWALRKTLEQVDAGRLYDGKPGGAWDTATLVLNTTYTFVTDGIEAALELARAAAGDKNVGIWAGVNIMRQYLKAGLLDEMQIHLVPVLLGGGVQLFEDLDPRGNRTAEDKFDRDAGCYASSVRRCEVTSEAKKPAPAAAAG